MAVAKSTVAELLVIAVVHTSSWGLAYDQALTERVVRMIERNNSAEVEAPQRESRLKPRHSSVEETS